MTGISISDVQEDVFSAADKAQLTFIDEGTYLKLWKYQWVSKVPEP